MSPTKQKKGEVRTRTRAAKSAAPVTKPTSAARRNKAPVEESERSPQSLTRESKLSGQPTRSAPMEHDLGPEEMEFIAALDRFKLEHGRPFPTWSEVLTVIRALGYRKV